MLRRHAGFVEGAPPNLPAADWAAEGTLKAGWLEMDTLGLLQQLGAVKPLQEIVPNLASDRRE